MSREGVGADVARGRLTVVGIGLQPAAHCTPLARSAIRSAERLFYLCGDAFAVAWLHAQHPQPESLHPLYPRGERDRSAGYARIAHAVAAATLRGARVCFATYGHPGVFARPMHHAIGLVREGGGDATMLPGISAEDCLIADLGVDPARFGMQSYEATDFLRHRRNADPHAALLLWQAGIVDDVPALAALLGERYGATHEGIVYEAAPHPVLSPLRRNVAVGRLLRSDLTPRATLYVPPRAS